MSHESIGDLDAFASTSHSMINGYQVRKDPPTTCLNDDSNDTPNPYKKLEGLIEKYCLDQKPHIHLHPHEYGLNAVSRGKRDYTDKELDARSKRDFETRLFITNATFEGDSVWVRTHFSDNHMHRSVLNAVRDLFKAAAARKNYTAGKAVLSELLTTCMHSEKSDYHSFAITMASGLSGMAENTSFEVHRALLKDNNDFELLVARRKLCMMMNVIFSKIGMSNFLYGGDESNIYRLVHCLTTVSEKDMKFMLLPGFSFLLQVCLTGYVISDTLNDIRQGTFLIREDDNDNSWYTNILLACLTLVYSSMIAYPSISGVLDADDIYDNKWSTLHIMDLIINAILPFILLVSGFLVSIYYVHCHEENINTYHI